MFSCDWGLLNRLPGVRFNDPDTLIARAHEVDRRIRLSLTSRRIPFLRSLSSWLLVRLLQTLEIWILLYALLPSAGTTELVLLAILAQTGALLVGGFLAFVPGQIGVAEGGSAFLFGIIGYSPMVGLSMELVRRVCKLVGIAVGLVIGSERLLKRNGGKKQHSDSDPKHKHAASEWMPPVARESPDAAAQ